MATTNTNIPIIGAPAAWLLELTGTSSALSIASPFGSADKANRLKFDNLSENPKVSIKLDSAAEGDYVEIKRGDGGIVRFDAVKVTISGVDESVITDPADETSKKGEITIVTNEADMDSTNWASFLSKLKGKQDSYWLIAVPVGFSYDARVAQATKNASGYVYMVGKLSSAIEPGQPGESGHLSMTFVSVACPYGDAADWSGSTGLSAISWAGSSDAITGAIPLKGVTGVNMTVQTITSGMATNLKAGEVEVLASTF